MIVLCHSSFCPSNVLGFKLKPMDVWCPCCRVDTMCAIRRQLQVLWSNGNQIRCLLVMIPYSHAHWVWHETEKCLSWVWCVDSLSFNYNFEIWKLNRNKVLQSTRWYFANPWIHGVQTEISGKMLWHYRHFFNDPQWNGSVLVIKNAHKMLLIGND